MDVYERIKREMDEFTSHRREQPNKVFIGRDLCGEMGIDIYVGEEDLECDDWIYGMKIIPVWVNDVILITHDSKLLDTKEEKKAFIKNFMKVDPIEIDKELDKQIDEGFRYLQNEILFEKFYDEWCKKKDIEN